MDPRKTREPVTGHPTPCHYCGRKGHTEPECRKKVREAGLCLLCGIEGFDEYHPEEECPRKGTATQPPHNADIESDNEEGSTLHNAAIESDNEEIVTVAVTSLLKFCSNDKSYYHLDPLLTSICSEYGLTLELGPQQKAAAEKHHTAIQPTPVATTDTATQTHCSTHRYAEASTDSATQTTPIATTNPTVNPSPSALPRTYAEAATQSTPNRQAHSAEQPPSAQKKGKGKERESKIHPDRQAQIQE